MKKTLALLLALLFLLGAGCSRDMNWVISNEPSVRGTVEQIGEDYVLIRASEVEGFCFSAGADWLVRAEKATRLHDCKFSARIGDEVAVYYDGTVEMGAVPQISNVHGYCLITPFERENDEVG